MDGAFQFLTNDHTDTVQTVEHGLGIHQNGDGIVSGDGIAVIQKFALQTAADQLGGAGLEHQVALALNDGHEIVAVLADLLHLVEGGAGGHEPESAAVDALQRLPPQGQTEAVYGHHGQALLVDLKEGAGVDGTGLVGGNGEAGLVDHGLQGPLLDSHRVLVVHLRQLRVVLGGQAHDLEAGVAAGQAHHIFLIRRKHHQIVRQLPDDLTEQAGVEDDAALLVNLGLKGGADTGLHIVARHGQPVAALHQNALQCWDGAFGGHGTGHGIDGALQQRFFAGETEHILIPFLSNDFCHASQKENIN